MYYSSNKTNYLVDSQIVDSQPNKQTSSINKIALLFLYLLLSGDLAFIIIHQVVVHTSFLQAPIYLLHYDRGFAEFYQYMKFFWIANLFVIYFFRSKKPIFILWTLLYIFLLLDDSISIHENVGLFISQELNFSKMLLLRSRDFGELIVTGTIGLIFLAFMGYLFFRLSPNYKRISLDLLFLLGILFFFGVGIDMLHVMIDNPYLDNFFNILEDGGEMVAASFICWYVICLFDYIFRYRIHFVSPLQPVFNYFKNVFKINR